MGNAYSNKLSNGLSNDQIKIMFVDHTAKLSGGEIALLRLISAIDRNKYQISMVLFSDGEIVAELEKLGVKPIILPLSADVLNTRKESLNPLALLRLTSLRRIVAHINSLKDAIQREGPAIVHTNSLKSDIIGGIAARLAGVPVVWHIRDRISSDYLPTFATFIFRHLTSIIPNYVITNSYATMKTLKLPKRMHRVSVVYGGLSDSLVSKQGVLARKASVLYDGIAEHEMQASQRDTQFPTVGLIGRISPWKGQREFIDAAAIVLKERPDTRFEIIGSPMFGEDDYLHSLNKQVESLGVGNAVSLVGFRNDIPEVLSKLSVFVHASVLPEPFGQTVLEAMAAGVPTIATNAGAIPEIVTHGETGLLVPPGDSNAMAEAILHFLDNRPLAMEIACNARKAAYERFNITIAADRVQRIYQHILGYPNSVM